MTDVPPEEYEPDEPPAVDSDEGNPEEYEPDEPDAAFSAETGTLYDRTGEPETVPEDVEIEDES